MYTGAVYDESTGLLYLSSRYYDAQSGRFISMDSYRGETGNPLSLNLYGYCEGNPISNVDRTGEFSQAIVVGAVIGGFVGGGLELLNQLSEGKKLNWKEIGVSAVGGAFSGALMATGGGFFREAVVSFGTSFGEELVKEKLAGRKITGNKSGTKSFFSGIYPKKIVKPVTRFIKKIFSRKSNRNPVYRRAGSGLW